MHEPQNPRCRACAGRARACRCGGIVHLILSDGTWLCSRPGCDGFGGPVLVGAPLVPLVGAPLS